MLKKILFMSVVAGALTVMSHSDVAAQVCTGGSGTDFVCGNSTSTQGSTSLGFDPTVSLMAAVTNTDPTAGPCFTCVNTTATSGGTTAGALTNSMFGAIRDNSAADLGELSYNPTVQGMTVPSSSECGANCNDSGSFSFNLPTVVQNFKGDGTAAANATDPVTAGGVKITFSNNFNYDAVNGTTDFDQKVSQDTFIGGLSGTDIQLVTVDAIGSGAVNPSVGTGGGTINWEQSITDGSFALGTQKGSFVYNNTTFDAASAPTGAGQSNGTNTVIGQ